LLLIIACGDRYSANQSLILILSSPLYAIN